jgi:hypothetical protein
MAIQKLIILVSKKMIAGIRKSSPQRMRRQRRRCRAAEIQALTTLPVFQHASREASETRRTIIGTWYNAEDGQPAASLYGRVEPI